MESPSRVLDVVHPDDRHGFAEAMPHVIATGGPHAIEYRICRPTDGRTVLVRDTGFVIRGADGAVLQIAGVAQDITDVAAASAAPVKLIGVGEGIDDLQPFDARAYARSLVGLSTTPERDAA